MTMTRTAAVSKLTFPSYLEKEFDAILDSRQDLKIFSVIDVKLSALKSHSGTKVTLYLTDEPGYKILVSKCRQSYFDCLSSPFHVLCQRAFAIFCLALGPKPSPMKLFCPFKKQYFRDLLKNN